MTRFYIVFTALAALSLEAAKPSPRNFRSMRSRHEQATGFSSGGAGLSVGTPNRSAEDAIGAAMSSRSNSERTVKKVVFQGPKQGWGVTKERSALYDENGKKTAMVPAGRLFSYRDVRVGKTSSYLVVLFDRPPQEGAASGMYLLDCTQVAAYAGENWKSLNPIVIEKLAAYYQLKGEIEERKQELAAEEDKNNPYQSKLQAAADKYRNSLKRADELEKEMNAATGNKRNKIQEELRALKYNQIPLRNDYLAARQQAVRWRKTNPRLKQLADKDPKIVALREKLKLCQSDESFMAMIPPEQ